MENQRLLEAINDFRQAYDNIEAPPQVLTDLYESLVPVIAEVHAGAIKAPVAASFIPGHQQFLEGDLRAHPEFEAAYARLRIQLCGITPEVESLLERIERMKQKRLSSD